jgi:hypothetical protein
MNQKLYDLIYYKIWIKLYALIVIGLIHITWFGSTFLLKYKDETIIYGFPPILIIAYIIFIYGDIKEKDDDHISSATKKIDHLINSTFLIYLIIIIFVIILPNQHKKSIVDFGLEIFVRVVTKLGFLIE